MKARLDTAASGRKAESAVASHLQGLGYEICATNYLVPRIGELDLVVRRKNLLSVVEVKARSGSADYGGLTAAITAAKLRRLRKTAWCYVKENHLLNSDVSFLAAFVRMDASQNIVDISISPIEWL